MSYMDETFKTMCKDIIENGYSSEGQIGFNKWCIGTIDRALLFNYLELDSNVYGIANGAFLGYGSLIKVKIGDNTEIIGDKAFYDCKNISTLDLGHGKLKTIGHSAFAGCYSIPTNPLNQESQKSLESIGNSAFGWCTGMSGTLTLGNANENKLIDKIERKEINALFIIKKGFGNNIENGKFEKIIKEEKITICLYSDFWHLVN